MIMKLYTLISLSLLVAISNAQSNFNNNNINNDIIDDNNNYGQQTHKLALHNHKTKLINSRYTNHATVDIANRRLKNRNNNELSKREDIAKPNKREKRDTTQIGDDIALAIADDYDRKYNSNKRVQRKKNELATVSGDGEEVEDEDSLIDKRRHKDKNEEESHKVNKESLKVDKEERPDDAIYPKKISKYTSQEILDLEKQKKKKKDRTVQHTAAQSTKYHTPNTTHDATTTSEHQKRQKRGVNNEMINIFKDRISNINGSKQYKESIAGGGMSLDTIPSDMSMGKHAKQTKRHSKSKIKSVKSKVHKRPNTMSPSLESSSITPTMENSSSPTPTLTDESCEMYLGDDPCPNGKYCKLDTMVCLNKSAYKYGVCTAKPDKCIGIYDPVCGCDEITYGNACLASQQGVNVASEGECDNDDTKPPISSSPTNEPSHGPSSTLTSEPTSSPSNAPSQAPTGSSTVMESVEPTPTSSPVSTTESPVTEAPVTESPTPKPTYGPDRCIPEGACEGAMGAIGPGSCIGFESCVNSTGDIGSGSCQGEQACRGYTGEKIGSNSCRGDAACYLNNAVIKDSACNNQTACLNIDVDGEPIISSSDRIIDSGSCNYLSACAGNIGNISTSACNSDLACVYNSGNIESGGCGGMLSCLENEGNIASGACSADSACIGNTGSISNGGCNGLRSCYLNKGDVSEGACSSLEMTIEEGFEATDSEEEEDYYGACEYNTATIGTASCNEQGSCFDNKADIDNQSCLGEWSCTYNSGSIGSNSCVGFGSCFENSGDIENGSCRIDEACCGNDGDINSGTCNTVEDGCNNCIDE